MVVQITAGSVITARGIFGKYRVIDLDEALAKELIDSNSAVELRRVTGSRIIYWHITPEWQGQTACIIGGGPSLTQEQVDKAKGQKVIAVNNAIYLAPWANILYFGDRRWYEWHESAVHTFKGRRVTLGNLPLQSELELYSLRDYGVHGMSPFKDGITTGRNSGFQALQVAVQLGATRIPLLGFDMKADGARTHWHAEHKVATPTNVFTSMIECFKRVAPELAERGIEVINCSPDTALKCFPRMSIDEALN